MNIIFREHSLPLGLWPGKAITSFHQTSSYRVKGFGSGVGGGKGRVCDSLLLESQMPGVREGEEITCFLCGRR